MKKTVSKEMRRAIQSERDRNGGSKTWFHSTHGRVKANTKSEARAKFKAKGATGRFQIAMVAK